MPTTISGNVIQDEYQDSLDLAEDNDSDTSAPLTIDTEAMPGPAMAEEA